MKAIVVAAIVVVAALAPTSHSEETPQDKDAGRFFFGNYQTSTLTVVQASTSTVFLSCLSTINTAATCSGKRKKRTIATNKDNDIKDMADIQLDSSANSEVRVERSEPSENQKLGFTIWTTAKTTTTVTILSTNTATTIRLSYGCSAGAVSLPAVNCAG
ncbi:uncharacterized protein LOC122252440 [Penaeus japonicus]|uniref:uncharacterized protein LOC122252440 n=1 Tax=Penaeus japonicus TaxID=27405 RepID=UPI001C712A9C|nr:uncharacterized protein LOC122252440 [Penaeus japonicus]